MVKRLLLSASLVLTAAFVGAQDVKPGGALSSSMGIDQHFGDKVPLAAQFKDQSGKDVKLGDFVKDKPVVILPMFFGCNGVCRLEIEDLFKTLEKAKRLAVGKEFELVLLSINPNETPELANEKIQQILGVYNIIGADKGVHGLVGSMDQIRSVTNALGFRYKYNPDTKAINHPAGLMILDKNGVIRGYIYGAEFPTDILAANIEGAAKQVQAIKKPEIILLGCVMIDPETGKRTIVIEGVMKLLGCMTLLIVGGSIFHMSRKYGPGGPRAGGKTAGA